MPPPAAHMETPRSPPRPRPRLAPSLAVTVHWTCRFASIVLLVFGPCAVRAERNRRLGRPYGPSGSAIHNAVRTEHDDGGAPIVNLPAGLVSRPAASSPAWHGH